MKRFFDSLQLNKYFLGFVLLFAYFHSIQVRIVYSSVVNAYTFTPEAAVAWFIAALLIFILLGMQINRHQKKQGKFTMGWMAKTFLVSLLVYLLVKNFIGLAIALVFDTFDRNFDPQTILANTVSDVLDVCLYGGFYVAHFFYQKSKQDNQQLLVYNAALAENKIAQLKVQLNPHFLFNNLNALDQLIEEDSDKASDFLNDFAELYRYILQTSDKKLVLLTEELSFAKSYFRLMRHKYGAGYRLEIKGNVADGGYLPPLTLQLLLENAIEHNLGSEQNPIWITVEAGDKLSVTNNIVQKSKPKPFGGRSLLNLREQYALLSNENIHIQHGESQFSISLPIILNENL